MTAKKNTTAKEKKETSSKAGRGKAKKAAPKASSSSSSSSSSNPLKRSFDNSSKSGAGGDGGVQVSKAQQSGFVTYLRCCASGKDSKAANQAEVMLADYRKMSQRDKKELIGSFYASGGRKAGLQSIYEQTMSLQQKSDAKSWVDYATPTKIMSLHEVMLLSWVGTPLTCTRQSLSSWAPAHDALGLS